MSRISRDGMLAGIVSIVALRSTCNRKHVGAVIARGGHVLSIGYAGSPPGYPHCIDAGCIIGPDGGCLRTVHAEQNAIAFSARHGVRIDGADIWCTLTPCLACAKLIISSGIQRVLALEKYRDESGVRYLEESGVPVLLVKV